MQPLMKKVLKKTLVVHTLQLYLDNTTTFWQGFEGEAAS